MSGIGLPLLILAAQTPDDTEVCLSDENVAEVDFDVQYDLVVLTATTQQASRAYEIGAEFRKRGTKVALGGIHATVLPEEAVKHVDYVFTGEGETIWKEFLHDFERNQAARVYKGELLQDLDQSPLPRYDLLDTERDDVVWIQTTRGCPRDCTFCVASKIFGRKYRRKSVPRILEEIEIVKSHLPRVQINFADDNMFCNKQQSRELLRGLEQAGIRYLAQTDISVAEDPAFLELLKKSGCAILFIGFESIDPAGLRKLEKNEWKYKRLQMYEKYIHRIQSLGIGVFGAFIIGLDTDTRATFNDLIEFINRNHLYAAQVTILTPYPGSQVRTTLSNQKRLLKLGWEHYTCNEVTFVPKNFTPAELQQEHLRIYQKIYSQEQLTARARHFKQIYVQQKKRV